MEVGVAIMMTVDFSTDSRESERTKGFYQSSGL